MKVQQNKAYIAVVCLLGFFAGILYANIVSNQIFRTSGIFSEYFLSQYPSIEIVPEEYLFYILRIRAIPLFLLVLLGQTKIRKAVVSVFLFWTGFSGGILIVSAIFRLGMKGILLFMIAITPQFLFYILGYAVIVWYFYTYPMSKWNYGKTIFLCCMMLFGVAAEAYVNPILMKMFVRTM